MTALDPLRIMNFYLKGQRDFSFTFLDLSRYFLTSHLPKHLSFTPNLFPKCSSISRSFLFSSKTLSHSFLNAFHLLWPNFRGLLKNLGFFKIKEVLEKFCDRFCIFDPKWSCIASHLHYNNVPCILDVCLLICKLVCW